MNNNSFSLALIVLFFGLLSAPLAARQSGPFPKDNGPGAQPSTAIRDQCNIVPGSIESPGGGLTGKVKISTVGRSLDIHWAFSVGGVRKFAYQKFPLDYWPTAAVFHKGALIVAGRPISNGKTKIERWTLSYPPLPTSGSIYDATVQVEILYNKLSIGTAGRTSVYVMSKLLGNTNPKGALLLQFEESKDLYQFDMDSKTLTLKYTSTQVPSLKEKRIDHIFIAEVPGLGFIYRFSGDPNGDDVEMPLFIDSGKTGVIDNFDSMTGATFIMAYGTPRDWLNVNSNFSK